MMGSRYRKSWTDEELARLRELAGRHSTAQIAQELGRGVSATIHKAHELGISLRKTREFKFMGTAPNLDPGPAGMDLS
jgi:hypothetical protein